MTEKFRIDGVNNYIDIPVIGDMMPISMRIKVPQEHNWTTIYPVIKYGKNELSYNQLKKHIEDEEWHILSWDGKELYIDDKFCKL